MLGRAAVGTQVLERDQVAATWRRHYNRLHLRTVRWLSNLPGLRFSRRHGRWVSRDGVVGYLERYVEHHGIEVRTRVEVRRIDRERDGWALETPAGTLGSRFVVVATGYNHTAWIPDWPGRDDFTGELIHGSEYRNPEPYRGRDVLVVGTGNTGAEIAVDLVEGGAASVRIAMRTPPNIVLRETNGIPAQVTGLLMRHTPARLGDPIARVMQRLTVGDLSEYGMPAPAEGNLTRVRRDDVVPILDVGLVDALKRRQVEAVPGVERFDGSAVILADGPRLEPDAVIAATAARSSRWSITSACWGRRAGRWSTALALTPRRRVCTSSATRTRSAGSSSRSVSTPAGSPARWPSRPRPRRRRRSVA